jgi:hypothetical protein
MREQEARAVSGRRSSTGPRRPAVRTARCRQGLPGGARGQAAAAGAAGGRRSLGPAARAWSARLGPHVEDVDGGALVAAKLYDGRAALAAWRRGRGTQGQAGAVGQAAAAMPAQLLMLQGRHSGSRGSAVCCAHSPQQQSLPTCCLLRCCRCRCCCRCCRCCCCSCCRCCWRWRCLLLLLRRLGARAAAARPAAAAAQQLHLLHDHLHTEHSRASSPPPPPHRHPHSPTHSAMS